MNLLINFEIFQCEEGIVASLFFIHWPAVVEGKERGRGENEILLLVQFLFGVHGLWL